MLKHELAIKIVNELLDQARFDLRTALQEGKTDHIAYKRGECESYENVVMHLEHDQGFTIQGQRDAR